MILEVNCSNPNCLAPIQRRESELKRVKKAYCNNQCKWKDNPPVRVPELKGKYWQLEILGLSHKVGKKRHYHYRCVCGTERTAEHYSIKSGRTSSCGCSRSPKAPKINYQGYINRWEALEGLALDKPNLKFALEQIAKEFPVYV